MGSSMR